MKLSAIPDVKRAVDEAMAIGMAQHREEIEPFAEWLVREIRPHHVLEIGSLHGGTAWLWCLLATGFIYSVDLPDGRFGGKDHHYNEWGMRLRNARLEDKCPRFCGYLGDSTDEMIIEEVALSLSVHRLSMLFIDGNHTYEGVKADYQNYRSMVASGGCIVFHDILDTERHRNDGCEVDKLWRELEGDKLEFCMPGAPWGGIGVLRV